jgi:hypothetical protein
MLGATIEKQIPKLTPIRNVSLAVRSARVNAPLQTFTDQQVAEAREGMNRNLPFLKRVELYKILALPTVSRRTEPISHHSRSRHQLALDDLQQRYGPRSRLLARLGQ